MPPGEDLRSAILESSGSSLPPSAAAADEVFSAPAKRSPYFGQGYHQTYRNYLLTPETTRAEVNLIFRELRPRHGERWLDLPCGYGRHLTLMAEARSDLRLIGGDLTRDYLREAKLRSALSVAACDMRRLPFAEGAFHAVLNLFSSFGYYPPEKPRTHYRKWRQRIFKKIGLGRLEAQRKHQASWEGDGVIHSPGIPHTLDDRAALTEFARVLQPGGRLVLDLLNRRTFVAQVRRHPIVRYTDGNYESLERFTWDPEAEVLHNETRWRWPGGSERAGYRMRLYTPAQLGKMLALNGLEVEKMFGGFDGRAFNLAESDRMLVFAKK